MGVLGYPLEGPRPDFGRAVQQTLADRNLGLRQQSVRTGIDHMTMGHWVRGVPPKHIDKLVTRCGKFGLELNEWLILAGHEPIHSAADVLIAEIEDAGGPVTVDAELLAVAKATPRDRDLIRAAVEERRERHGLGGVEGGSAPKSARPGPGEAGSGAGA